MKFVQTSTSITLGEINLSLKEFKSVEPTFNLSLPRGMTRIYEPGKGRYLVDKASGEETIEVEETWEEGNTYLMNRYVYQAKIQAENNKQSSPGLRDRDSDLEVSNILKLPIQQRAAAMRNVKDASPARLWSLIRQIRNKLLDQSDWTQLPDQVMSAAEVEAWEAYRQQLRDLPSTTGDPLQVVWPVAPQP